MLTYDLLPSDEYSAAELLSSIRWPDGMVCPHCGNAKHSHLRSRPRVFVCTRCQRHQSVTAGTPLTRCRVPLCKVFRAAWLLTRPRSISARRLHLVLDVAYETAWSLCHRLRSGPVVDDVRLDAFVSMSELRLTRRPPYRRPWDGPPLRLTLMWDSVGRFVALPGHPEPHAVRRALDQHSDAETAPVHRVPPMSVAQIYRYIFEDTHRAVSDRWMPLYAAAVACWERARRSGEDPLKAMLAATLARTTHPFRRLRPREAAEWPNLEDWRTDAPAEDHPPNEAISPLAVPSTSLT